MKLINAGRTRSDKCATFNGARSRVEFRDGLRVIKTFSNGTRSCAMTERKRKLTRNLCGMS